MFGALGLWIISVVAGYLLFPENHLKAWGFFVALIIIHSSELMTSLKVGNEKGLSTSTTVIKTLLYGFTWWVPVRKGILQQ